MCFKRLRRMLPAAMALCAAAGASATAAAAGVRTDEIVVKAALIFNYTQFVEWPAAAFARTDAPFVICVAGNQPMRTALMAAERRQYRGHPISVIAVARADEVARCHVLYADSARALGGGDLDAIVGAAPVLTVSSSASAMEEGFGIGFVLRAERMRWNMNLTPLRRAKLKVSANLIEIAVNVVGEGGP